MEEKTLFLMGLILIVFYSLSLYSTVAVISWIDKRRRSSNRSLWDDWRFAHTLSQFLALGGIVETALIAISFHYVSHNAFRACEESLRSAQCSEKASAWQSASVSLGILGLIAIAILIWSSIHLIRSYDTYRSAFQRITHNRPNYLIVGHVSLQMSATFILLAAFSRYFIPDRDDVDRELKTAMAMGIVSIIFYNIGAALNLYGTYNTHLMMSTIRREAMARNYRQAALIIWFRPVSDDAEDQIRSILGSLRDALHQEV
ncbi:MAG: hypothetical protein LQ342_001817 [Letrouitia transgressa]|nr:MAG: hypothetical protein LQ342_001817 [Letrouitia transgressa]